MIPSGVKVFLASHPIDFRKGPDSLLSLVRDAGSDPFNGALYVFRAKRADRVKIVWWDGSGVCLYDDSISLGTLVASSRMIASKSDFIARSTNSREIPFENLVHESIHCGLVRQWRYLRLDNRCRSCGRPCVSSLPIHPAPATPTITCLPLMRRHDIAIGLK